MLMMFDDEGDTAQQTIARAAQNTEQQKDRTKDRNIIRVSAVSISKTTGSSTVSRADVRRNLTHSYL
jgi:hypothetical protein